jgi:probable F420-dependent oxidoreductase
VRVGLHALGIGAGAKRDVIEATARAADACGFATLWVGEHVVMVDDPSSRYPYAEEGRIPVPPDADWLDPLVALGFVGALTSRIRLATGVLLLPEHNPVVVAKQAATVDSLTSGRLVLGVGIGWSAEEFAALGVPFEGRARRTEEYVQAIRTLWRDDVATFHGEFAHFDGVRVNPRPVHGRCVPVFLGGNGSSALRRVASIGDGWYGFNLSLTELAGRVAELRRWCRERGRDPDTVEVAVAASDCGPEHRGQLSDLGVDEAVVVANPPGDAGLVSSWVEKLAYQWLG